MNATKRALFLLGLCTIAGAELLFIFAGASPAQQIQPNFQIRSTLEITSPRDGALVAPGQTITVVVSPAPGTAVEGGIFILGEGPLPNSVSKTNSPYSFSLTIPTKIRPGNYQITAVGGVQPLLVRSRPITLTVEKTEPIADLRVEPTFVNLGFVGDQFPIRVIGTFSDGTTLDLEESSQTTYSYDSTVINVDGSGTVIAVGGGKTNLVVHYGNKSVSVPVSVPRMTIAGDLNGDGKVDQNDLDIILGALNNPAVGSFDARDLNKDGVINMSDAKQLVSLCTSECGTINIPPDVTNARPSEATLWPPNHRMVPITILGVADPDGDPFTITINKIRQDEPTNGLGDGDTCPDAQGIGTSTALLRAERSGTGNGRVYTILFTAQDSRGGKSRRTTVQVCVPHDQGGRGCEFTGFRSKPAVDSTVCPP